MRPYQKRHIHGIRKALEEADSNNRSTARARSTCCADEPRRRFWGLAHSLEAFSSDERDRVYGILGLPCLAGVVNISPGHNCDSTEILTAFSQSLFMSGDLYGFSLSRSTIPPIGTRYFKRPQISRPRAPKLVCRHRTVNQGCRHGLPSWGICFPCSPNLALPLPRAFPRSPLSRTLPAHSSVTGF